MYKLDVDGCSVITFLKNLKNVSNTVILVKDENDYLFGGYCKEPWEALKSKKKFFGSGENILFTFQTDELPYIYKWSGDGNQHMHSNKQGVGLGGHDGKFSLYLSDNFSKGESYALNPYGNQILSKNEIFRPTMIEVWAIKD